MEFQFESEKNFFSPCTYVFFLILNSVLYVYID